MNLKKALNSRSFKFGAVSTAITAIFIVVILVINIVATVLTSKFPLTIDLTPENVFALSDESIEYVKGVDQPVNIYVLSTASDLENAGNIYYTQVKRVIDQYSQYNSQITLSYIDIVKDPTFTTLYPDLTLNYGDVLVESGERYRLMSIYDMFNIGYNSQTGQQYIASSKADEMMTSAILGVTSDEVIRVGFITGHQEDDSTALKELLQQNNFEVVDVNLQTEDIDSDIEVLFWNAPKRDPDESLMQKLDDYMSNNKNYGRQLFYAASSEQPSMPNLDAFLEEWGIAVGDGAVAETNSSNILSFTSAFFCTVEYVNDTEDNSYTERMSTDVRVAMPFGRPLKTLFDSRDDYMTRTLLTYSPTAVVRPSDAAENWTPSEEDMGEVPALIHARRQRYDGLTALQSNLFVFSSSAAFDSSILSSQSVSNADYLMSILNIETEREDVVSILPKDLNGTQLGITTMQATVIAVVMVIVVPLLIVIAGFIVWLRRRHM